jgi:hypothetical protein
MSKAVRIREHLYAEIGRLAAQERRSLIAQLEVLLEQALQIESSGAAVGKQAASGSAAKHSEDRKDSIASKSSSRPERVAPDSHFKPDPK